MMENNNADDTESSTKVNVGIRALPALKSALNYEALELGQTTSEYAETILANRHKYKDENEQLKQELEKRDKTIAELKMQATGTEKLEGELLSSYKEVQELKDQITKLSAQNALFKDKRLQYLFEQLKGKKDKVKNAYSGGDFDIVYDSPKAVLTALIYSSKLNP